MNYLRFIAVFLLVIFGMIMVYGTYNWIKEIVTKYRAKRRLKKDV